MSNAWPYKSYTEIFMERQQRIIKIQNDPILQAGCKEYYRGKPVEFIQDFGVTYDPRNASSKERPTVMPFCLFPRQVEFIQFLHECYLDGESGIVEKTRDAGITWCGTAYSVYLWLFEDGSSIGWGSRKEILVDKISDPDSVLEKVRMQIRYLPKFLLPKGFSEQKHFSFMKIVNPENGATITGEAGSSIGRGGRKAIFFVDEAEHIDHLELIEASLSATTNVRIDISSVNGNSNIIARKRQQGEEWEPGKNVDPGMTRVFIFDWKSHPLKDEEWYNRRRDKAERDGLLHIFAQEVDRDRTSSVTGVVIKASWVKAAVDLHKKYPEAFTGLKYGGLDLADEEEGDSKALAFRKGIVLTHLDEWHKGDAGQATVKAVVESRQQAVNILSYDCIGVGATAKSEVNRLKRDGKFDFGKLEIIPWAASGKVLWPDQNAVKGDKESPKNKDTYKNIKAQAYWSLRSRFEKTYKFVYEDGGADKYAIDELISIDSKISNYDKLVQQLSQPTYSHDGQGRIIIDKNPNGVKSPDLADAVNMAFFPVPAKTKKVGTWGK